MDWRTINPQDESVLKIDIKVAARSFLGSFDVKNKSRKDSSEGARIF